MAEWSLPSQSRTAYSLQSHRPSSSSPFMPWNLNMWRNIMHGNYSRLWLWQLDSRVKVWRRNKECYAVCCTDRLTAFGRSSGMVWDVSLEAISVHRDIEIRFCSQWQCNIPDWNWTVSFNITMFDPTEWGLSETISIILKWRGENGLPAVLISTSWKNSGISLGVLFVPE